MNASARLTIMDDNGGIGQMCVVVFGSSGALSPGCTFDLPASGTAGFAFRPRGVLDPAQLGAGEWDLWRVDISGISSVTPAGVPIRATPRVILDRRCSGTTACYRFRVALPPASTANPVDVFRMDLHLEQLRFSDAKLRSEGCSEVRSPTSLHFSVAIRVPLVPAGESSALQGGGGGGEKSEDADARGGGRGSGSKKKKRGGGRGGRRLLALPVSPSEGGGAPRALAAAPAAAAFDNGLCQHLSGYSLVSSSGHGDGGAGASAATGWYTQKQDAFGDFSTWHWQPASGCAFGMPSIAAMRSVLHGRWLAFVGDLTVAEMAIAVLLLADIPFDRRWAGEPCAQDDAAIRSFDTGPILALGGARVTMYWAASVETCGRRSEGVRVFSDEGFKTRFAAFHATEAETGRTPAVLVFNSGLHDLAAPDASAARFGSTLERDALPLLRRALPTGRLIWRSTSPKTGGIECLAGGAGSPGNAGVDELNDVAWRVINRGWVPSPHVSATAGGDTADAPATPPPPPLPPLLLDANALLRPFFEPGELARHHCSSLTRDGEQTISRVRSGCLAVASAFAALIDGGSASPTVSPTRSSTRSPALSPSASRTRAPSLSPYPSRAAVRPPAARVAATASAAPPAQRPAASVLPQVVAAATAAASAAPVPTVQQLRGAVQGGAAVPAGADAKGAEEGDEEEEDEEEKTEGKAGGGDGGGEAKGTAADPKASAGKGGEGDKEEAEADDDKGKAAEDGPEGGGSGVGAPRAVADPSPAAGLPEGPGAPPPAAATAQPQAGSGGKPPRPPLPPGSLTGLFPLLSLPTIVAALYLGVRYAYPPPARTAAGADKADPPPAGAGGASTGVSGGGSAGAAAGVQSPGPGVGASGRAQLDHHSEGAAAAAVQRRRGDRPVPP